VAANGAHYPLKVGRVSAMPVAAMRPQSADRLEDDMQRIATIQGQPPEGLMKTAKFGIGHVVKHRVYPFRGVIFDVDPVFANTEEWLMSIPEEVRPRRDQPFYHLLAENAKTTYVAYVSEQNLLADDTGKPVGHPQVTELFAGFHGSFYEPRHIKAH
jgi:heat shock protein HspQ